MALHELIILLSKASCIFQGFILARTERLKFNAFVTPDGLSLASAGECFCVLPLRFSNSQIKSVCWNDGFGLICSRENNTDDDASV